MKLFIIIGIVILLICVCVSGCLQEEEPPNDTNLFGEWHSTSKGYEITFHKNQTYTSNFLGLGSWHINNSELVIGKNTFDYKFVGDKLHLSSMHMFFIKVGGN